MLLADNGWLRGQDPGQWRGRFLPPSYVPRRTRLEPDQRVVLVVGPRQSGKSTLIWRTLADRSIPALYLNCEEPSIRDWLRSPAGFLSEVEALASSARALFFEEIQRLPDAGLFLKGVVDRRSGLFLFATGSSSFDLEARVRESLAGRARRHLLLPFSLEELAPSGCGDNPLVREQGWGDLVRRSAIHGSYPGVVTAVDPDRELASLVESLILRDASDRFKIRNVGAFRKLMQLMASQVGNLVNNSEWASLCSVSNDTVADYAQILEDSHVIRLLRPYVGGKRAELTSAPKVYFVDNGIRNQLFGGFAPLETRPDRGPLLENLVFSELLKRMDPILDSLRYWRSKAGAEVDFVLDHRGSTAAIEVKASARRGTLSRSARSFIEAYEPSVFLVVCSDPEEQVLVGRSRVRHVPIGGLTAELDSFLL
ncbi:MAG: ATP-binding protein [Candidatus Riflebacteria bacterium]|nr:ATP-binding protein [Candidatus Riflebacteria bacterium]